MQVPNLQSATSQVGGQIAKSIDKAAPVIAEQVRYYVQHYALLCYTILY